VIVDETSIRHMNLQEGRDNPKSGYDPITALQDKEWIVKNYDQFVTNLEVMCEMKWAENIWSDPELDGRNAEAEPSEDES